MIKKKIAAGIIILAAGLTFSIPALAAEITDSEISGSYTEAEEETVPDIIYGVKKETDSVKTESSTADEQEDVEKETEAPDIGASIAEFAKQFLGGKYVYSGSSLTNGTDCSGFTMSVFRNFGIFLPHSSSAQRNAGTAVGSLNEAKAGDLICYSGHVALYLGDGKIIHAMNKKNGITISDASYNRILAIRRLV